MNALYVGARGLILGFALFGLLGYVQLILGMALLPFELPVALVVGVFVSRWASGAADATPPGRPVPSALTWLLAAVVLVGFGMLAYGALATPSRGWDGIVAWELKANALALGLTFDNPLFADPAAFHHSPSYPLLQPLCVASVGRLLFPLLWLLFVGLGVGAAHRLHRSDRARALVTGLAFATVPFFLDTSGGSADSGYAEMFFAIALTAAGAGLLLRDGLMLTAAAALLPLLKPEGAVLGVFLPFVPFVFAERGTTWWRGAFVLAASAIVVVLIGAGMLTVRVFSGWAPVLVGTFFLAVAGAVLVILLRRGLDLLGRGAATRLVVLLILGVLPPLLLLALPNEFTTTALGQYVTGFGRLGDKLAFLPDVLLGLLQFGTDPKRFGLTFVVALLVLAVHRRRALTAPGNLVLAWLGGGLAIVFAALMLSPEPDVLHSLKSSAPRLLAHWTGVAWLWVAAAWPLPETASRPAGAGAMAQPSSN